jgi:hypothetical protein
MQGLVFFKLCNKIKLERIKQFLMLSTRMSVILFFVSCKYFMTKKHFKI